MVGQKPVAKFRAGQVSCAVWENEIQVSGVAKVILKATVSRRYRDRNGDWRSADSFSRNEIPLAVYCLEKAFEAILAAEQNGDGEGSGSNGVTEEVVSE